MVPRGFLPLLVAFSLIVVGLAATPSSYLSSEDKDRIKEILNSHLNENDLASVAYSTIGLKHLSVVPQDSAALCQKLQKGVDASDVTLAAVYQATAAASSLAGCSLKLSAAANQVVSAALASEASVPNLFYAVFSSLNGPQKKVDSAAVLKTLTAALKKDDSLANLGFAFQIASVLDADVSSVFDRIEDAIVQADEVDGKFLQFDGGLAVTSNIIVGAYKLASHAKVKKTPPISKVQAVKFANYFLSRKNVHQAKGAVHLLEALKVFSENGFHVPVAISLDGAATVSEATPKVRVRVSDLLGQNIGKMEVVIESAMRQSDGAVILANSKMSEVGGGLYEIDMQAAKPGRGFYELTVTATPSGKSKDTLIGNSGAILIVKALTSISVEAVELGVGDSDQSTALKTATLSHPNTVKQPLDADHHQKVVLKFAIKDSQADERIKVHQAFVRLSHGNSEIIFVAESDSNLLYKFDLDVSAKAKEFGSKSGSYGIHLIIGDSAITNSFSWHMANINLKFSESDDAPVPSKPETEVKPEIRHLFREPEKRPPPMVSNTFTLLCLAPVLVMFVAWLKIGVNISNMPFSLASIGFHAGLASIFGLYYCFWLQLDMFTTIKYLIMISVVTFLCGNSLLVKLAEKRNQSS